MNRQLNIVMTISFVLIVAATCLVGFAFPTSAQYSTPVILTSTPQSGAMDESPIAPPEPNRDPDYSRPPAEPVSPITTTSNLVISDQYFLTGYPWETSEVQQVLEEHDSVLAIALMDPYGDGVTMPASEAMASLSSYHTVSPPVMLTLAEMDFGLLSRKSAVSEPLTPDELAAFTEWYNRRSADLSERFYQIDNLVSSGQAEPPGSGWDMAGSSLLTRGLNSGSHAVVAQFAAAPDVNDPSGESTKARIQQFIDTYTRFFGSPLGGNIRIPNPRPDSSDSTDSSKQITQDMPLLYLPWTGTDQWNFTGGPHGTNWSALDFQPTGWGGKDCIPMHVPDRWMTAMAGGKVISSSGYQVVIDHDNDGKISTGWQTKYYHVYNIRVSVGQTVTKNTQVGNPSCYGDRADGVHGHFEIWYQGKAQQAHGKVIGGWTVEKGSSQYSGYLKKGNLVRQALTTNKMVMVSNNCSPNKYYAEYYNSLSLDHTIYPPNRYGCENVISYEWGSGGPGSNVNSDNFIVRWEGEFTGFQNSDYTFVARADDGVRVYLDNRLIINKWIDQGPTAHYARQKPAAGSHHVKVEYYERGGGATARIGWCSAGAYVVDYYRNRTMSGTPSAWGCQGYINYDWGTGSPVSSVTADNFSARWMGYFNFSGGTHHFFAKADDGIRLYVDNSQIINAWQDQGPTEYRATRTMSSGLHPVMVEYYEAGGGAMASAWWSQNLALNRTATATSVQDSNTYAAYKGNDGNNGTRWSSSATSALLRDQWWIVDLGGRKTFSQFRINWENAYAKEYWVAWKDGSPCSGSYTGYLLAGNRAGWVTHNVGLRTANCIAIVMVKRGPFANYSFWETELFSPIFSARSGKDDLTSQEGLESILFYSDGGDVVLTEQPAEFHPVNAVEVEPLDELIEFEIDMNDVDPVYTE